jgi:hypothetical protein
MRQEQSRDREFNATRRFDLEAASQVVFWLREIPQKVPLYRVGRYWRGFLRYLAEREEYSHCFFH